MTFKAGDSLIVLYNFKGQKAEDLPCKKDEKITIVKIISDPNWITCSNSKRQQGLVPINHVRLFVAPQLDKPWYHGNISRNQAEQRLSNSKDGAFLVRSSDKYPGDFTIAIRFEESVQFYHVFKSKVGYSLDEETWFESMPQLITHYQEDADGLCCMLDKNCDNVQKARLDYLEENGLIINAFELTLGQKIGCGEFSEVLQGEYRKKQVAVKCFKKNKNFAAESLFTFESSLMAKLNHPNLVTFIGMSVTQDNIFIITEFMENGSLVNYLRSRGRAVIKVADQVRFAVDCCLGMCYLEEHCLVHRDLAARNILLNVKLVAKVSDFGLAKADDSRVPNECTLPHDGNGYPKTPSPNHTCNVINDLTSLPANLTDEANSGINRIPVKWTAPEALVNNKYTNKSDVWSFGILLWEIFSFGRTPYPRIYANYVRQHLLNGYRMESPEDTPKDIYELMRACWALEPEKRPNFSDIQLILDKRLISS